MVIGLPVAGFSTTNCWDVSAQEYSSEVTSLKTLQEACCFGFHRACIREQYCYGLLRTLYLFFAMHYYVTYMWEAGKGVRHILFMARWSFGISFSAADMHLRGYENSRKAFSNLGIVDYLLYKNPSLTCLVLF